MQEPESNGTGRHTWRLEVGTFPVRRIAFAGRTGYEDGTLFIDRRQFEARLADSGAIAAVAGTVTAWGVTTRILEQDWTFLPGAVAGTIGFCVLLTLSLGLFGTWRALGESASPYLRNE